MREILFKAKRADSDTWIEGNLLTFDSRRYIINDIETIYYCPQCDREETREVWFAVIPETVSQFTGLYDKNGVRIFENDIVIIGGANRPTVVEFSSGSWQCVRKYTDKGREKEYSYLHRLEYDNHPNQYEVIGNRFDNSDLLKGE